MRTYSGAEGKPIAEKSAKTGTAGTTLTWLFSNLEGTVDVQTVANAAGTTTRTFRDPYGAPIGGSNGVWSSGTGYMNKPVTASTGLTTVGARTYDPVLGKFLSVDPVIDPNLPQQNTGYTYSGNNPTTYMDPTGLRLDEGCGWARSCGKKPGGSGARQVTLTPSQAQALVNNLGPILNCAKYPTRGVSCGREYAESNDKLNRAIVDSGQFAIAILAIRFKLIRPSGGAGPLTPLRTSVEVAPKPLGLGSTGRTSPGNLHEQLAMEEVRTAPGGRQLPLELTDPRWPASDGRVKMQQVVNGVNIHYVRNTLTGAVDDFKFVGGR